jgi:fused signal recognition particle receptor
MVFDWFRRATAQPEAAPQTPQDPGQQAEAPAPPEPEVADAQAVPAAAEAPAAADSAAAAPEAPPAIGAVDETALEWARQAYARLKAQQQVQAEAPAAAQPVSPPVESVAAPVAVSPLAPAASEPQSSAAAAEPLTAPVEPMAPPAAADLPTPVAPAAEPEPAPPPLPSTEPGLESPAAPPAAAADNEAAAIPGLSLLERAAAQRQQRLQELSVVAEPAAAAPQAPVSPPSPLEPAATAAATAADEPAEPSLGAFDDTFTWSAEVLAAQGRRVEEISLEEIDWLGRLRQGLEKTRRNFVSQLLENLGDDPLTPEVLDDLETTLLRSDVGVQATDQVLEALRRRLNQEVVDPAEGLRFLKQQLRDLLEAPISASQAPLLAPQRGRLNVWLMVGVNGVGKTTTLGKLANLAVRSGYSCLIAAADTFRAAAVQQVQVWGQRSGVPVVSNPSSNADPAAVVYDAIGAAKARGTELVLVDTAGRLQTKHNLMEELSKVRRIIDRLAPEAVVESLLVLDASQGQNGLRQAMAFASAAGLTGVVITKLDGSARGGVALAVASEAGLPIRFIGAGEGIRDLRPFNSFEFVEALLAGSR